MEPWIRLTRRELEEERPEGAGAAEEIRFPERLAERVMATFSSVGDVVLDPFAGFGTTAVVALRMGRRAIAVELLQDRADVIRRRLEGRGRVIVGDARRLSELVSEPIELCFTSPPYMTRAAHPQNPMTGYRTLDGAYETYLDDLASVGAQIARLLRIGGHLVVNAATIVREGEETPLAEDLARRLSRHLVRRPDLPIAWDHAPEGIAEDRCLVFEKVDANRR